MKVEIVDYEAPDAAETLARSLRDTGFAVLRNHPITAERIEAIYDSWGSFFAGDDKFAYACLLYTSPSPRDRTRSRMPSSA